MPERRGRDAMARQPGRSRCCGSATGRRRNAASAMSKRAGRSRCCGSSTEDGRLGRAKRVFAANLVFFAGLVAVALYLFQGDGEEAAVEADIVAEEPSTLPELAYLKGQMAALREHPATMPAFEEAWVREVCLKRLLQDVDFAEISQDAIEGLVDDFYLGYAERFEDYYDTRHARRCGYEYGLRFDPAVHPQYNFAGIRGQLARHEARLRSRYELDRAEWMLFEAAFYDGFEDGFLAVKDGVTIQAGRPIPLTFD